MSIEQQLREALEPRDPGEDFTTAVMSRVAAPAPASPVASPALSRRKGLLPLALAASLLLAFVVAQGLVAQKREQRALAARAQLEQALDITSAELNQVQLLLNPGE